MPLAKVGPPICAGDVKITPCDVMDAVVLVVYASGGHFIMFNGDDVDPATEEEAEDTDGTVDG